MSEELKPCPHCGGEAELSTTEIYGEVNCTNEECTAASTGFIRGFEIQDGIESWNQRQDIPRAELERVIGELAEWLALNNNDSDAAFGVQQGVKTAINKLKELLT